jgi:hypothetical protein
MGHGVADANPIPDIPLRMVHVVCPVRHQEKGLQNDDPVVLAVEGIEQLYPR